MIVAILLSASMTLQAAASDDAATYREAVAAAHVRLALWCEARGMAAERLRHLTRAVLLDPSNRAARGLLGQVEGDGRWSRPEDVRSALEADPRARSLRDEYLTRRAASADTLDGQISLARWCGENGLDDQSVAHYRAALRIDPGHEAVWKRLGYKKYEGRWALPAEIAAEKSRADALRKADRRWRPELGRLRDRLASKDAEASRRASDALDAVADPLAVPTIWDLFARGDARRQRRAAEMFARIDGRSASLALAELAVASPHAEVRGLAADLLDRRDPRDYLDPMLELIHKPFRYQVQPIAGVGSEGGLFAEGDSFKVSRLYQLPPTDWSWSMIPGRLFTDDVPLQTGLTSQLLAAAAVNPAAVVLQPPATGPAAALGAQGLAGPAAASLRQVAGFNSPGRAYAEAVRRDEVIAQVVRDEAAQVEQARGRLAADVAEIERVNSGIRDVNDRVLPVVRTATGRDFGEDGHAWKGWWSDQLGYAYRSPQPDEKPTYTQVEQIPSQWSLGFHSACFAAGTPVQTLSGPVPIEDVKVGDLVLSQDVETGDVSFKPVLLTHASPPAATLKLRLGGEELTATGIHRFWRPGKGWTMARDLKAGDLVRTVGGVRTVEAVEPGATQVVFNLDVAENLDFFVGRAGFLVHDFSIVRDPGRPFDAPEVEAVAVRR